MVSLSSHQRHHIAQRLLSIISFWGFSVAVSSYFGLFITFPLPWFALLVTSVRQMWGEEIDTPYPITCN